MSAVLENRPNPLSRPGVSPNGLSAVTVSAAGRPGALDHHTRRTLKALVAAARRERLAQDNDPAVRPALRCSGCGEWKPDGRFGRDPRNPYRHSRKSVCRACESKARREYRDRRKQPCVGCGQPALPPGEKGPKAAPFARCRACYHAALRALHGNTSEGSRTSGVECAAALEEVTA